MQACFVSCYTCSTWRSQNLTTLQQGAASFLIALTTILCIGTCGKSFSTGSMPSSATWGFNLSRRINTWLTLANPGANDTSLCVLGRGEAPQKLILPSTQIGSVISLQRGPGAPAISLPRPTQI